MQSIFTPARPPHDPGVTLVTVFSAGDGGGNPAPVVLDARGLDAAQMRAIAAGYGHESAFVLPPENSAHDFRFRFFVPNHEMEMCGHATVGALWLLRRERIWQAQHATVETLSGLVHARVEAPGTPQERIEVSQPQGVIQPIPDLGMVSELATILGVQPGDMMALPVLNARTSRVKTLIALHTPAMLHGLQPDFSRIEAVCAALDSTGLYPFAPDAHQRTVFHARQFPRASGYREDAATGIAATALLYGLEYHGLAAPGAAVTVQQGQAMGRPSAITVRFAGPAEHALAACWLSGKVELLSDI